ncbi:hypothetical protein, partial [Nostoc sp.]
PELRLAKLQDVNGNIFYGKADTNGAIARGEDIRLRRGSGMLGYDAMPHYNLIKQPPKSIAHPSPVASYFIVYQVTGNPFKDPSSGGGLTSTEKSEGSTQEISIASSIEMKSTSFHIFFYFYNDGFRPLLALNTTVIFGFIGLKNLENVKLKLTINTSYSLENLDIAYFVNKSGAHIEESVPSPLRVSIIKNNAEIILDEYGDASYGNKQLEVELTGSDFNQPYSENNLASDQKVASITLASYIRAQDSIFYGGIGENAEALLSHQMEIEIESVNDKKLNLKRKILES